MPTLREHTFTIDRGTNKIWVVPAPTYDLSDPGDNLTTPAWWKSRVAVDQGSGQVRIKMRAARAEFTCLTGVDQYTMESDSAGVEQVLDFDSSRVVQNLVFDPSLPQTDGRAYDVETVSIVNDPRAVKLVFESAAGPLALSNLFFSIRLISTNAMVAPHVGATYKLDVLFWAIE